jgi:hypothetical protein
MLTFTKKQIDSLDNHMKGDIYLNVKFIKDNFPDFLEGNTGEINKLVEWTFDFSRKNKITKLINIQRLVHYQVEYNLPYLQLQNLRIVCESDLKEDVKVDQIFFLSASEIKNKVMINKIIKYVSGTLYR